MAKVSNGDRPNVNKKLLNGIKNDQLPAEKMLNIQKAWLNGKNPWMTIDNPNKEQTNKKKIRVKMNDIMGSAKERAKKVFIIAGTN